MKISETTYYQRNREIILNTVKECYKNDKKRLRERAKNKYKELSEEENKKREHDRNKYCNISRENKQKLKEY